MSLYTTIKAIIKIVIEFLLKLVGRDPKEQENGRKQISGISRSDQLKLCSMTMKKTKNIEEDKEEEEDQERYLSDQSSITSSRMNVVVLPCEMLYEILTRVSLHQLVGQFPFLSKELCYLTHDSKLRHLHSQRTPTLYGYLIETWSPRGHDDFFSFSNNQLPSSSSIRNMGCFDLCPDRMYAAYKFRIVSASFPHGLFCCLAYAAVGRRGTWEPKSYCICKPTTREFQMIPLSSFNYARCFNTQIALVVIRCNPLHYKIFRFSSESRFHMFDSKKWRWTTLKAAIDYRLLPKFDIYNEDNGVLLHGSLNWLTKNRQLCSMNVHECAWKIIEVPKDEEQQKMTNLELRGLNKLVDCEGELGLLRISSKRWLELWVLKDTEYITWEKIYRVSLEPILGDKKVIVIEVLDYYMTDIVLMKIDDEIIWFDIKNGSYSVAKKVSAGSGRVHKIHSDFVPCNLRRCLQVQHNPK